MALGLLPVDAVLNDINPHLVNFYLRLQRGLRVTIKTENLAKSFYAHRDRFNQLIRQGKSKTSEAAQLFYYLNRTGYNGLCRFNRSGEFNVPFGRHTTINYRQDFRAFKRLFCNWSFSSFDIEAVPLEPGDFVYADPPYDVLYSRATACV